MPPVLQHALLPLLGVNALAQRGVDDHELARDAPGLREEPLPLGRQEVPVEVAREDPIEGSPSAKGSGTASPWTTRAPGRRADATPTISGL